ncbi:hypothetical protein DRO69_10730 [Candidatus Bathyarchaeota archaeon]|mgnify:CR=1 FL=1|nr:MAG: hypothetical protein DRO69_10730 [Candidatus Bathyarchaeota archaeon]
MNKIRLIRNEDIEQVLIGVPKDHKHLRVYVKLKTGGGFIFQEATIANLLRAYITIKTHPTVRAKELKMKILTVEQQKEGFAAHQLLETLRKEEEIEKELSELLKKSKISF